MSDTVFHEHFGKFLANLKSNLRPTFEQIFRFEEYGQDTVQFWVS